jgi:Ca-activated chloride channel family protein
VDVKLDLERELIAFETAGTVHLQVTVTAPALERPEGRKPLNVAVVLDRSGSMAGEKLNHALHAIALLVDQLAADDMFSLVAFDSNARVVVPAGEVRDKARIKELVRGITAGSSTDLSAGWFLGVSEAKRKAGPGRVTRVLLLTDGQTNAGIVEPKALINQAHRFVDEGVELSTLGYGQDFNEDLLSPLAVAGGGNFYYVANPDQAPGVFLRELKGLLTLAAQNLRVRIKAEAVVQGLRLLNALPVDARPGALDVALGSVAGGEQKILVLALDLAAVARPGRTRLGEVTVEYDMVVGDVRHESHTYPIEAEHVEGMRAVREQPVLRVIQNVFRMKSALVRKDAIARADQGDTAGAQKILQTFRDEHRKLGEQSAAVKEEWTSSGANRKRSRTGRSTRTCAR